MSEYLREPEDYYDRDEAGNVINSPDSYKQISNELWGEKRSIVFPWSDESGRQFTVLMAWGPEQAGDLPDGASAATDLFVALGVAAFNVTERDERTPDAVAEKLNVQGETAVKLAHLIGGVIFELMGDVR